uniref:Uncharacterized protein AlNc14C48G3817 n=1 Tax=Albugo laibachii Nc14 TaxID=890382 RepID=F0WAV5_9STRA|nr:conserved hypothetical protein [Albugo laibachii Nc14]CCA18449.1 conserved hypothetical protein [Albugo laibachii Nc14]|eukprot:CCA18449.1 conserved hypothetical protein [Albugo laibachii Nc14]
MKHPNVERYIRREEELVQARDYRNKNERIAICANWEERLLFRKGHSSPSSSHNLNSRSAKELDIMNKETLQARQKRLLQFYQSCYEQWEVELNKNGLAILRERD